MQTISIIGAGSWGTAIAALLAGKGHEIVLWAYEKEVADGINRNNKNPLYLSQIELPKNIRATSDIEEAVSSSKFVVSVVPSHAIRNVWKKAGTYLKNEAMLVSCTKGIEKDSLKLMSEVLTDCLPSHPIDNRVVLSGPSFAKEVAMGLPTSVVIAGSNTDVCKKVQEVLRTNTFLTFTNEDVKGVEVGGAVKNVIAIATGMSDGLKLGHNSRASIITRGLYEMIKIGKALGANPLTFSGLSGIGDLVLTCTADLSRNHTLGREIGEGRPLKEILSNMKMVAEGLPTAKAVNDLIKKFNINAPICGVIYRILYENLSPREAIAHLCTMKLKEELGSIV